MVDSLRVTSPCWSAIIGSVYFKPTLPLEYVLEILQASLDDIFAKFPDDILILGGDVNASVAESEDDLSPDEIQGTRLKDSRKYMVKSTDHRGETLMNFMADNGLILLNGRTSSDYPARYTSSKTPTTPDLVWISADKTDLVNDMWVSADLLGSNHLPITLQLEVPELSTTVFRHGPGTTPATPPVTPKRPYTEPSSDSLLWRAERANGYTMNLGIPTMSPRIADGTDINACNLTLTNAIEKAAKSSGMARSPKNSNPRAREHSVKKMKNPWFDADCVSKKKELRKRYDHIYNPTFDKPAAVAFDNDMKSYKKMIKHKKSAYEKKISDLFHNVRDPSTFWRTVASVKYKPKRVEAIGLAERNEFLISTYPQRNTHQLDPVNLIDADLDADITYNELLKSIRHAKKGKAPGNDNITNEFLKGLSPAWIEYLLHLFNAIFDLGVVPDTWTSILLCMIYKKGEVSDPLNYRGIALVNSITKLFTAILNNRLYIWAEIRSIIPIEQAGFRENMGVMDNVTTLQMTLQNRLRQAGGKVYGLFVDFRRAFDSVSHQLLWQKLLSIGVSYKLIRIIKSLYDRSSLRIRTTEGISTPVDVSEGVLQGEKLSPLLFNLFLSDIVSFFRDRGAVGVAIDNRSDVCLLLYADDLIILASSSVDLKRKLQILEEYCRLNGLTVNIDKTKVVVFRRGGPLPLRNHDFVLNGSPVEIVPKYTYLGTVFSSSAKGFLASRNAILKARKATGVVLRLTSKLKADSWTSTKKLFCSIVTSTLVYTASIWGLRYLDWLEIAQTHFIKRLYNLPLNAPGYLIRLETGIDHVSIAVIKQALRWVKKILDMKPHCLPKICLLRQINLFRQNSGSDAHSAYNWVQQLNDGLNGIGISDLWDNLTSAWWSRRIPDILDQFRAKLKFDDYTRYCNSTSIYFNVFRHPLDS